MRPSAHLGTLLVGVSLPARVERHVKLGCKLFERHRAVPLQLEWEPLTVCIRHEGGNALLQRGQRRLREMTGAVDSVVRMGVGGRGRALVSLASRAFPPGRARASARARTLAAVGHRLARLAGTRVSSPVKGAATTDTAG